MRISACYIVRDEVRELARSLESIAPSIDELVIVATDDAALIEPLAMKYRGMLYEFPWQDDFAAARNFALEKATGDWIVFFDADEYLAAATVGNLCAVIERYADSEILLVPWHNIEESTGATILDSYAPRIFRRRPNRRYEGAVHEELRDAGKLIAGVHMLTPDELTLVHTGYSAKLTREKGERNLQLLRQTMANASDPSRYYRYLADTYANLGDNANAEHYALLDIERGRSSEVYASRSFEILLTIYQMTADYDKRLAIVKRAAKTFPELASFQAEYAEELARAGEYLLAVQAARRALEVVPNSRSLEPIYFDDSLREQLKMRCAAWQRIGDKMQSLKITSCLIVRNGERDIKDWLANSEVFADERIVIDTDSTDNTLALLADSDCRVYKMAWKNDFAAARNLALDHADGDWAAVLDADEVVFEPAKVRGYLAKLMLTRPEVEAVMVPLRHVDELTGARQGEAPHIRFVRLGRGLYYEGLVHERLRKSTGEVIVHYEKEELAIRHVGYSANRIHAKHERNLELLKQEIEANGMQAGHNRYLADTYFGLCDYQQAERYARLAIAEDSKSVGAQSHLYRKILDCMMLRGKPLTEQIAFAKESLALFPQIPDFYGRLGLMLEAEGDILPAGDNLGQALAIYDKSGGQGYGESSDFELIRLGVIAALARIKLMQGELAAAEQLLAAGLAADSSDERVLDVMVELELTKGTPADIIRQMLAGYLGEETPTAPYMNRLLKNLGWLSLLPVDDDFIVEVTSPDYNDEVGDALADNIREIPSVLLQLRAHITGSDSWLLYTRLRSLLPGSMRTFMEYYDDDEVFVKPLNFEGYDLLREDFIRYADGEQVALLMERLFPYGDEQCQQFLEELMKKSHYAAAFSGYRKLLELKGDLSVEELYNLALSLTYMGERDTARVVIDDCLAKNSGLAKAQELKELLSC